jgi:hypothetical protein
MSHVTCALIIQKTNRDIHYYIIFKYFDKNDVYFILLIILILNSYFMEISVILLRVLLRHFVNTVIASYVNCYVINQSTFW